MARPKQKQPVCKPRFRVLQGDHIALGPGKVDLLESIERTGSISKGARELNLSYRRAWDLVHTINQCFKNPVVHKTVGGKHGGGACLTPFGKRLIRLYRTMELKAAKASLNEWKSICRKLKKT